MEDWAEIRALHRRYGLSKREIARRLGISRVTMDPADRFDFAAGDQAQCDLWFPPVKVPLGHGQTGPPPVLVMVTSFSRFITATMIPSGTTPDLLAGHWPLLYGLGVFRVGWFGTTNWASVAARS